MQMNSKELQSDYNKKTEKKAHHYILLDVLILFLMIILLLSAYTFILQKNYVNATVDSAVAWNTQCSDAIHKLVSNKFTREDFNEITSVEDMKSERYMQLQQQLNELRSLNSTRYLYTAKRGEDGRLVYLIDGLDLGAEDFAFPGTYIEEEMIPYIDAALSGQTIYSQEIIDTTWGHIFTACYPVVASDGTGDIIGALCMEMDMEHTYRFLAVSNRTTTRIAIMASVVLLVMGILLYISFSRQKQYEAEQQQALEVAASVADAANQAKSTFLFNMSHDIRTPMNAILGFAELAERSIESPEKLRDCLGKICVCGKKMLAILDNILEFSRIESGKATIEETPVESGSILDASLVMLQTAADKKKQKLTVSKEISFPYIYMDATRISEIILNLVSNSIKYTPEGGEICCSLLQKKDEKEGWIIQVISVSDNGIGMSQEFQKHIFELFSRERSSTESGVEGTGLGMGIVKKLVDMMNGTIEVYSKIGKGTTFVVQLPCRIASYEDTQPKRADELTDASKLTGKRILLAEDNDLNAEIAIALLSETGLIVDRAENGVKCFEMLENAEDDYYSLILMDIQMPILDGYATTKKIRKMNHAKKANIPIIAMTANAFAEDRKKAMDIGMNDHIAKPIDMNKMIPTLLKYL